MSFTNFKTREIHCKVAYFGPQGSGKTENLRSVHKNLSEDFKAGTWIFDGTSTYLSEDEKLEFFALSMGEHSDFHIKLHLYTLPILVDSAFVKSVFFRGLDALVFVADSRISALGDNIRAYNLIRNQLSMVGIDHTNLSQVIQYNKRDLKDIVPISVLRQALNIHQTPDIEAVATQSIGTLEALRLIAEQIVLKLNLGS